VVNSAIETYQNSSSGSKSRTDPSNPSSTLAHASVRRSDKNTIGTTDNMSKESLVDVSGRRSSSNLELDDLVVDENTGRVTAATPDSLRDMPERHMSFWPL
jgi:hypothetical protein